MISIVGHGPTAADPDGFDYVVRLHRAELFVGTRTDAICATMAKYEMPEIDFWFFDSWGSKSTTKYRIDVPGWLKYFQRFRPLKKPSTGMCAIFGAKQFKDPQTIYLTGFDSWRGDTGRYYDDSIAWPHDADAEQRCAKSLFKVEHF